MTLDYIKNKKFTERKKISDISTFALTQILEKYGHWKIHHYATKEEDIKQLVDLYVTYPDDPQTIRPIQFKVRTDPKYKDFIVARYQPCYGISDDIVDDPSLGKTCNGRDWRGLINKCSYRYYIATMDSYKNFNEISFCDSNILKKRVIALDKLWEKSEVRGKFKFTKEAIDKMLERNIFKKQVFIHPTRNDEVWYQKNYNERPKFLMYIENKIRDGYFKIENNMQKEIETFKNDFLQDD